MAGQFIFEKEAAKILQSDEESTSGGSSEEVLGRSRSERGRGDRESSGWEDVGSGSSEDDTSPVSEGERGSRGGNRKSAVVALADKFSLRRTMLKGWRATAWRG